MKSAAPVESPFSPDQIQHRVRELGQWFHNLDLAGVETAPNHFLGDYPGNKWRAFADALPPDLRGRSVLDIGCNAGFYALEMKRRGAARVVAIDPDEQYLAQARFAAEVRQADIEFHQLSVYQVGELGETFDLVQPRRLRGHAPPRGSSIFSGAARRTSITGAPGTASSTACASGRSRMTHPAAQGRTKGHKMKLSKRRKLKPPPRRRNSPERDQTEWLRRHAGSKIYREGMPLPRRRSPPPPRTESSRHPSS